MNTHSDTFKRYEEKYLLNPNQHQKIMQALAGYAVADSYGQHTISNLYFDTDDWALIRHSIEKPVYKEKLRLRSYGIPRPSDPVFLELKKKFDGIVYKRRIQLTLTELRNYLAQGRQPGTQGQILKEIDWFMHRYHPEPKVMIAYERLALYGKDDPALRLTFDTGIRFRESVLDLSRGHWGKPLLPAGQVLLEIKIPGAMPVWLSHTLNDLNIFPVSFSKYGQIYKEHLIHGVKEKGGIHCA